MFNPTNLPRGDRSRLMACNVLMPCTAVIIARVLNEFMHGIQSRTIFWGDNISEARSVTNRPPDRAKLVGSVVTLVGDAQCDAVSC